RDGCQDDAVGFFIYFYLNPRAFFDAQQAADARGDNDLPFGCGISLRVLHGRLLSTNSIQRSKMLVNYKIYYFYRIVGIIAVWGSWLPPQHQWEEDEQPNIRQAVGDGHTQD